jgi:hypothetical protein
MFFCQQYNDLYQIIVYNIQNLPLYNAREIDKKLTHYRNLKSVSAAHSQLMKFCVELKVIVELFLSKKFNGVDITSHKQLNKILNAGNFVTDDGIKIKINSSEYIKAENIKANILTICSTDKMIALLETLQEILANNIVYLANNELSEDTTLVDEEALTKLQATMASKLELQKFRPYLNAVEKAIEKFDAAIMRIYECPVTLVYNDLPTLMVSETGTLQDRLDDVLRCRKYVSTNFKGQEVIFIIAKDTSPFNLSSMLKLHYYYAIKRLRAFALSMEKKPALLIPKKADAKQRLLSSFNREIKDAIKDMPLFIHEEALKHILKAGTSHASLPADEEVEEVDVEEKLPNIEESKDDDNDVAIFDLAIIGRNAKQEDLIENKKYKFIVINNNPSLLAEADLAYKILRLDWLLLNATAIFAKSPKHLFRIQEVLTEDSVNKSIRATTNDKDELVDNYNQMLQKISGTGFSFETNSEMLAIGNMIHTEIELPLQLLIASKLSAEVFAETMLAQHLINKNINTASKMLSKFSNFYPTILTYALNLAKEWRDTKDNLEKLSADMETLNKSSSTLAGHKDWLDRSREPLTLLQDKIASAQKYLDAAKTAFAKTTVLSDSNKMKESTAEFDEVKRHLALFKMHYMQADSEVKTQTQLIANAYLRRQSNLQLFGGMASSTSTTAEHKSSRRPG